MAVRYHRLVLALVLAGGAALACETRDTSLPEAEAVAGYYESSSDIRASINGNVAEIYVQQSGDQLRRGGSLWARVGPYVFLFSPATRDLLADYPGLAAVRVVTVAPGGAEVARALLPRDQLNTSAWRRALNVAGRARVEGTERVSLIEELVRFGEAHTTYTYDPAWVR